MNVGPLAVFNNTDEHSAYPAVVEGVKRESLSVSPLAARKAPCPIFSMKTVCVLKVPFTNVFFHHPGLS